MNTYKMLGQLIEIIEIIGADRDRRRDQWGEAVRESYGGGDLEEPEYPAHQEALKALDVAIDKIKALVR